MGIDGSRFRLKLPLSSKSPNKLWHKYQALKSCYAKIVELCKVCWQFWHINFVLLNIYSLSMFQSLLELITSSGNPLRIFESSFPIVCNPQKFDLFMQLKQLMNSEILQLKSFLNLFNSNVKNEKFMILVFSCHIFSHSWSLNLTLHFELALFAFDFDCFAFFHQKNWLFFQSKAFILSRTDCFYENPKIKFIFQQKKRKTSQKFG